MSADKEPERHCHPSGYDTSTCWGCHDWEQWRKERIRSVIERLLSHVEECGCADADDCPHPFRPGYGHVRFTAGADSAIPEILAIEELL